MSRSVVIIRWGQTMQRSFASSAVFTFVAGLLLSQALTPLAQAQRVPDRITESAVIAPPLITAKGAETPVGLRSASVEVETNGSLARTTLLLTLYNPNDRLLEGTLQFPVQAGQQVSAFALDIGGELRDAVPVPKQQAQQVFESIERRQVDPGLLEQTAGNHFRLRVYPIPARGIRQVRLVIDEAMRRDGGDAWRLDVPVHLLAGAGGISMTVRAQGLHKPPEVIGDFADLRFERKGFGYSARYDAIYEARPYRSANGLSLRLPADDTARSYVQTFDGDRFVLAEMILPSFPGAVAPRTPPSSVGLLWDASASARKHDHDLQFFLLDQYFALMGNGTVALRYLRDIGTDAGRFEIKNGDWRVLRKALESTVYDGASDLADWTPDPTVGEYLLISDGLRNYGAGKFPELKPDQRLFAIAPKGGQTDLALLTALTETRGGEASEGRLASQHYRVDTLSGEGVTDLQAEARNVDEGVVLRVAGHMTASTGKIRIVMNRGGKPETFEIPVAAEGPQSQQVAGLWAHWKVASFAAEPERHRAEVARIGQRFGIVTPGTSLLVLEAPEDYVRYDIPAPPALQEQVAALRRSQAQEKQASQSQRLDDVTARFTERLSWFTRKFPKGAPPKPERMKETNGGSDGELDSIAVTGSRIRGAGAEAAEPLMDAAPPPVAAMAAPGIPQALVEVAAPVGPAAPANAPVAMDARSAKLALLDEDKAAAAGQGVSIQLQAWAPDSPYARRLRGAKAEDIYAIYLDERDSYASSTAFYLDVADLLLQKGRRAEALRVLSNLAELDLENRHVLRVLGYRLMQAKDYARAAEVFREVLRLADEEPQSHRDLGLALAASGQRQEGIEHLYDVAARPWDSRFSEVELVALNELNAIIATSPQPLDTTFIDRRLLNNMPLDLRVVLGWDSDNSDMDLWVTDPNGERCYYGNRNTYQGGVISDDFTGGYGPEEFVLRDAKPGKYKVEANFFGDNQQIVTGATTLSMMFSTGWGTRRQQDKSVTLRLNGQSETVFVGEFEVK
jgi:Ca-activated chloride channel homolog